jgi:hypothetical protein
MDVKARRKLIDDALVHRPEQAIPLGVRHDAPLSFDEPEQALDGFGVRVGHASNMAPGRQARQLSPGTWRRAIGDRWGAAKLSPISEVGSGAAPIFQVERILNTTRSAMPAAAESAMPEAAMAEAAMAEAAMIEASMIEPSKVMPVVEIAIIEAGVIVAVLIGIRAIGEILVATDAGG